MPRGRPYPSRDELTDTGRTNDHAPPRPRADFSYEIEAGPTMLDREKAQGGASKDLPEPR